jgi:hypothetical protein
VDLSKPAEHRRTDEPAEQPTDPARPGDATGSTDGGADGGAETAAGADDASDLDDEGYTPPKLGAMPPAHPVTKWGLVALGLGLVLLIFPMVLGLEHSTGVDVVGVLAILGGVGLLVSRLSDRSTDEYDGPDDGAVV